MLFPLFLMCPSAYYGLAAAASMRHAMVGMPPHLHYGLMRAFYPI
jgi:hypothetical protein